MFTDFWKLFPLLPLFLHFLDHIKPKYQPIKSTDQLQMVGIPTLVAALEVVVRWCTKVVV